MNDIYLLSLLLSYCSPGAGLQCPLRTFFVLSDNFPKGHIDQLTCTLSRDVQTVHYRVNPECVALFVAGLSSQAQSIETLLTEVLLVPRLSEKVERSTLTEHLQMNNILSAFLQYNAAYIQRYIYYKVCHLTM